MRGRIRFRANSVGFAALPLMALALAQPAIAEENADLDEDRSYAPSDIVVTGQKAGYVVDDGSTSTKTPTPLIDTPQAVSVVTRDQLDDQAVRQLGDALRYVAGISMETGEGHRDEVFIRGQETTADFFLNGLRDDAQYYRPLYNVERIEVLKGANALTFGRGGGGGIINRVSKVADPLEDFVRGSGSVGTFGQFSLATDINAGFGNGAAGRLNATYEEFDNHRDYYAGRFFGIAPTVSISPGDATVVTLGYSYDDDERVVDRGVPSLNGGPLTGFDRTFFGDPDFNFSTAQVHILRGRIDHQASDTLALNATVQFADYDKAYQNVVPGGTDGTTVSLSGYRDTTERRNWIGQANAIWEVATGTIDHMLLAGVEFSTQDTRNGRSVVQLAGPTGPVGSVSVALQRDLAIPAVSLAPVSRDRESSLESFSAYLQDQIELSDFLQVIAGVRFERFDLETVDLISGVRAARTDEKWSPRLGIVLKPQDNVSLYASYTRSFLPQAGDQFFVLTPTSATFSPEKFDNYEIGAKWAPRPDLLLTAAVFQLERSNTQAPDPNGTGLTVLTGKSRTRGLEVQLGGNISDNWHVNAGYTYLDGEIRSDTSAAPAGRRLQQLPKHHIAAWSRYDLTEQFGLGAGLVHSSSQFTSFSNAVTLPAYTRVDLAAYFTPSERISFQMNVENLFDEDYYPSAHGDNNIQPAAPLSASVSATVSF